MGASLKRCQKCERHRSREHQDHLVLVAVPRCQNQGRDAEEPGQRNRARLAEHSVELVQAHDREHDQGGREDRPARDDDRDRKGRPRKRDEDACRRRALTAPGRPRARSRAGRRGIEARPTS